MIEDSGYNSNGFIGVLNLDILQVEWLLHFTDTYTFNPKAMIEIDSTKIAVVGNTNIGNTYIKVKWFSTVNGEYLDGMII